MQNRIVASIVLGITLLCISGFGQDKALLTKTITKTDRFDFGAGGTVAITGAPVGSIKVIGSPTNEIEIAATIEIQAASEADLAKLASVTTFVTDETPLRTGIITVSTSNKLGDKKMWKKFPKNLIGLPFRIDYEVKVPKYCDLEIEGGNGDLSISGVQGSMRINFLETNAHIDVIAGNLMVTVASGTVDVGLGVNGWRARPAVIQVGKGDLTVELPSNTSAELDAMILRTGSIENLLPNLKKRDRKVDFTDRSIIAKAGVGGTALKFTVGDGTLRLKPLVIHH